MERNILQRTRIALIVDDLHVTRWQAEALVKLPPDAEFLLLNCTNTRLRRRPLKHGLYYLLNIIALKPPPTKLVELPDSLRITDRCDFESEWDGGWQRLPLNVLSRIEQWRADVAIKFGMGLMRVPPDLKCKVLSYHHGDPRLFRGRPAGFYELLSSAPKVGQMVQIISNRLDAGQVVAFAETRAHPSSYRATMDEAYRTSPLLLRTAVQNTLEGKSLPLEADGRNYRLPSNWKVLRFAAKLLGAKLKRLGYGAFFYKEWEVAWTELNSFSIDALADDIIDRSRWVILRRPRRYRFLADPFPHPEGGVLVEALRACDSQGEIVHFGIDADRTLCQGLGHFSYPATLYSDGEWLMLPEVSEWSVPKLYRLRADTAELVAELDIEGAPRLADATMHKHGDLFYLFGSDVREGSGVLRLWTAPSVLGTFKEHSHSPIRISPSGSRMAGAILTIGDRMFRLGQDGSRGYGRAIMAFEITTLTKTQYSEQAAAEFSFTGVHGPHTFNRRGNLAYFDFYVERFTPLAGFHRIRAYFSKLQALTAAEDAQRCEQARYGSQPLCTSNDA